MTVFDDDVDMWEQAWADRLLKGEPVDGDRGLSDLVSAVRATADTPAPAPNAALAALLREGLPTVDIPEQRRVPKQVRQWGSRTFRAGLAGVAASLAMGAGVATAAAGGSTGPLSYIPEPVKRGVDAAVTAVADVLRPQADEPAAPQPAKGPATSDSGTGAGDDTPAKGNAPAPAPAPAAPTTGDSTPAEAPVKPVPTPAGEPSAVAPSVPPSTLPSPEGEESPEPGPSSGPDGTARKPLDTEKGGASPSPSPSPSASPSPSTTPPDEPAQEGEQQPEGEQPPEEEPAAAVDPAPTAPAKGKPARADLTVETID